MQAPYHRRKHQPHLILISHTNILRYLITTGISSASSCSGRPEGLSLRNISAPRLLYALESATNSSFASNGTKSEVIHSPLAVAMPCAIILPSQSTNTTGKLASKYQYPRASPVMVRGRPTVALGSGAG